MKLICRVLVVSLLFLSFQASAAMIGTDHVATATSASAERMHVQALLSRTDVTNTLQSMGVDSKMAADRVAALTDEEVRSLSGKLNSVPAGASDGWEIAIAVIVIGAIVWWVWYRK